MHRKNFVRSVVMAFTSVMLLPQDVLAGLINTRNNFRQIYLNTTLKGEFYKFLQNVFNLFPEKDFHKLIADTASAKKDDQAIYLEVQSKIDDITPMLSSVRYAVPALMKQKDEMARQALELLGEGGDYTGYL